MVLRTGKGAYVNTLSKIWEKLREKPYRDAFVASQLKRGLPTQIRVMLKDRGWKQSELAERSGLKQGVISRAADPDYGNLTINTILKIASGFDVAYVGRFVPFSDLARWYNDLSEDALSVPDFAHDAGATDRKQPTSQTSNAGATGRLYVVPKSGNSQYIGDLIDRHSNLSSGPAVPNDQPGVPTPRVPPVTIINSSLVPTTPNPRVEPIEKRSKTCPSLRKNNQSKTQSSRHRKLG
jgi:transcriptional regulator with XRE-family HTH domain